MRQIPIKGATRHAVAAAVHSRSPADAGPGRLLRHEQGHGQIEHRLHGVHAVTFDEDRCHVRTGSGPQVLAALRTTAIGAVRRAGFTNGAEGLRHFAAHPHRIRAILGLLPAPRL